jgi:hypothetical protein
MIVSPGAGSRSGNDMIKLQTILSLSSFKLSFLRVSRFFLAVFLVTFPFQVQSLVYTGTNFLSGNFNPFQVYAVHLPDIFLLISFLFWGLAHFNGEIVARITFGERKMAVLLMIFVMMVFGGILQASDKVLAFYLVAQMMVLGLFFMMVVNGVLKREEVLKYLLAGLAFQAGLAVVQYLLQHSAGVGFLGEPAISPDIPGVAKIDWDGIKLLRSYGTFSHANILGGALFMAIVLGFYLFRKKHLLLVAFTALVSAGFLLSFSRSAAFALMAAFLLYVSLNEGKRTLRYVLLAVSMLVFFIVAMNLEGVFFQRFFVMGESDAMVERANYMAISKRMLFDNPWGVGIGGFTRSMQDYSTEKIAPWVFQPVHNVFLLVANETGFLGAILLAGLLVYMFYSLVKSVSKKNGNHEERNYGQILLSILGGIVIICFFDHYFYSIYQGQVLIVLFLALASSYLKRFELPRRKS